MQEQIEYQFNSNKNQEWNAMRFFLPSCSELLNPIAQTQQHTIELNDDEKKCFDIFVEAGINPTVLSEIMKMMNHYKVHARDANKVNRDLSEEKQRECVMMEKLLAKIEVLCHVNMDLYQRNTKLLADNQALRTKETPFQFQLNQKIEHLPQLPSCSELIDSVSQTRTHALVELDDNEKKPFESCNQGYLTEWAMRVTMDFLLGYKTNAIHTCQTNNHLFEENKRLFATNTALLKIRLKLYQINERLNQLNAILPEDNDTLNTDVSSQGSPEDTSDHEGSNSYFGL